MEALRSDFVSVFEQQEEQLFQETVRRPPTESEKPFVERDGAVLRIVVIDSSVYDFASEWKEGIEENWKSSWTPKFSEPQREMLAFVSTHFDSVEFENALGGSRLDVKALKPSWMK